MMRIPERGTAPADVLEALEARHALDLNWRTGRSFGYVYAASPSIDEVAKAAYASFLSETGLDPTMFRSVLQFENEVVAMCIDHLGGDEDCVGNFTSGGTESILLAVLAARERFSARRPGARPEVVVPRTAHAGFHKSAHYLGLDVVVVEVDAQPFRADPAAMAAACTENTALLVGSASGYAHGVVDPIPEIAAIAAERDLPCHVDGCIGAFVLPFFRELGVDMPPFDFAVPGVSSISMDLHKYAYCPKGASVVLHRHAAHRAHQLYACTRWSGYGLANATAQSTKSGGPVAASWAVLQHVGRQGFLDIARGLRAATEQIVDAVDGTRGLRVLGAPEMCLLALASTDPELHVFHLADLMAQRGWYVQPQLAVASSPAALHLTILPVNVPHIDTFVDDLAACVAEARATPTPAPPEALTSALAQVDLTTLDDDALGQLLSLAGIGQSGELPEDRCEMNLLLDAMSYAERERVFRTFFNGLFVPARGG